MSVVLDTVVCKTTSVRQTFIAAHNTVMGLVFAIVQVYVTAQEVAVCKDGRPCRHPISSHVLAFAVGKWFDFGL